MSNNMCMCGTTPFDSLKNKKNTERQVGESRRRGGKKK